MKIAILFPGQGSQYIGMVKGFVQENSDSATLMQKAESVCQLNLKTLCEEGPMEELIRATNLQPAITAANLICWEAFQNAVGDNVEVSCFAGHSLGEYSALCAAGIVSFEDTLRLVAKRGALMEREGDRNPGGMRAVLGLSIDELEEIIKQYSGKGVVTAANHNTPQQVVISGSMAGLDSIGEAIEAKGGKIIPLNVSVANHSPLVADAVPDFKSFIKGIEFNQPNTPVYFNVSAEKETDTETMKNMMARQIASKVRWCEIIESMLSEGVDTFIEIGPKTVLKGMMRKITPRGTKVLAMQCDSPETLADCLAKLN